MLKVGWQYGQFGPGGGSFPSNVMRTGQIGPYNPERVRHDVQSNFVRDAVRVPVGHNPNFPSTPSGVPTTAPTAGVLMGAAADGRPVRKFDMSGAPTPREAKGAAQALKRTARFLAKNKLFGISPELIGGPLASLASGEATVLRWSNGVQIGTSL